MAPAKLLSCLVPLLGLLLAAEADAVSPRGEIAGTASFETVDGPRTLSFSLVVTKPTPREETLPLRAVLAGAGQLALLDVIRGAGGGKIRLGAAEAPVDLVVAEAIPKGWRYVVVTGGLLEVAELGTSGPSLDHPFTCFVLDVPDSGTGAGEIYPKSALSLDETGQLTIREHLGAPGTLTDVKRVEPVARGEAPGTAAPPPSPH